MFPPYSTLKSSDSSAILRMRINSSISITGTEMNEKNTYDRDWKSM
jgi:hypothetical protein